MTDEMWIKFAVLCLWAAVGIICLNVWYGDDNDAGFD